MACVDKAIGGIPRESGWLNDLGHGFLKNAQSPKRRRGRQKPGGTSI
jgi:hypothetical protein